MRPDMMKNPLGTQHTEINDISIESDALPSTVRSTKEKGKHIQFRPDGNTSGKVPIKWMPQEDDLLRKSVIKHGGKNWRLIAAELPIPRTPAQCIRRFKQVLNPHLVKGYWSKEEDERLIELVNMFGTKWATVARALPGRDGKQCRERWCEQLDPTIKKDPWNFDEDVTLFLAQEMYGKKWAEIAKLLPGRSGSAVKNRWNRKDLKNSQLLKETIHSILQNLTTAPPQEGSTLSDLVNSTTLTEKRCEVNGMPSVNCSQNEMIIPGQLMFSGSHGQLP